MLASFTPLSFCQSSGLPALSADEVARVHDVILEISTSNYDPGIGLQDAPILQDAFARTSDVRMKENIASVLMMLGKKDDVYWSVLVKRAQEIVDSQAPYPLVYDETGKSIRGKVSPEFLQWAKNQNVSPDDAFNQQLGSFPLELFFMAEVGDPRGLPILRKGLISSNYTIRVMAARGLALLQAKDSIPLIIEAAQHAPSEIRWAIAEPLVAFSDPKAQAAAEDLILDQNLLNDVKQRVKEKGARGIW